MCVSIHSFTNPTYNLVQLVQYTPQASVRVRPTSAAKNMKTARNRPKIIPSPSTTQSCSALTTPSLVALLLRAPATISSEAPFTATPYTAPTKNVLPFVIFSSTFLPLLPVELPSARVRFGFQFPSLLLDLCFKLAGVERRLGFRIAKVVGEQKGGGCNSKKRSFLGVWTVPESIRRPLVSTLYRFGFRTFTRSGSIDLRLEVAESVIFQSFACRFGFLLLPIGCEFCLFMMEEKW